MTNNITGGTKGKYILTDETTRRWHIIIVIFLIRVFCGKFTAFFYAISTENISLIHYFFFFIPRSHKHSEFLPNQYCAALHAVKSFILINLTPAAEGKYAFFFYFSMNLDLKFVRLLMSRAVVFKYIIQPTALLLLHNIILHRHLLKVKTNTYIIIIRKIDRIFSSLNLLFFFFSCSYTFLPFTPIVIQQFNA